MLTGVAAAGIAALSVLAWVASAVSPDLSSYRLTPLATDAGYQGSPAWSPDGKTLAYVANTDGVLQVFTRSLSSPGPVQVTQARFDCREPFWSPDGTRLYYLSLARERDGLWSISAGGGEPELVLENCTQGCNLTQRQNIGVLPRRGGRLRRAAAVVARLAAWFAADAIRTSSIWRGPWLSLRNASFLS